MPIVNGAYDAPTWNNNAPPAIDASELQDMCDTIETYGTQKADVDYVNTFVRPNLLDNAYFIGGGSQSGSGVFPINQRGSSSYSSSTNQITIDRWMLTLSTDLASMSDNGMTISTSGTVNGRSLRQAIENPESLAWKTVTMSVLVGNVTSDALYCSVFAASESHGAAQSIFGISSMAVSNGLITITGVINNNFSTYPYLTAFIGFMNQSSGVGVGATAQIKAAKLELGSTQTLAHQENGVWVLNEVPNYQQELAKCQRYFVRFGGAVLGSTPTVHIGFAQGVSTTLVRGIVPLPVQMRLMNPAISYSAVVLRYGTTDISVSGHNTIYAAANDLNVEFTGTGFEVGKVYQIRLVTGATYDVSADL